MEENSSSTLSSGVLISKDQLLRVFSRLRTRLLLGFLGFTLLFLLGFILSFWLTLTDKRWRETFDNLKEGDWTFFSLTKRLTKNSSNYWLGSLVSFIVFQLLVVYPLFGTWEVLRTLKLLRVLRKQTLEKTKLKELRVFKRKTLPNFYLGVYFFRLLNKAGYSFKVLERVEQNTEKQKEIFGEEVVAKIARSSNRRFWVFLLFFALFRVFLRWFYQAFIGITVFVGFYEWDYYVKIVFVLALWLLVEVFILWFFLAALIYLYFWLRTMLLCASEVVYTSKTIHWDKLLRRRLMIPLPINLIFQRKKRVKKEWR